VPFVLLAGPGESLRAANSSADCNQCGCTTIYVVHHAALCCTCHCATVPRLYCNIPSIHASKGIVVVKPSPTRHGLREASTMPCSTVVIAMARERGDVFPTGLRVCNTGYSCGYITAASSYMLCTRSAASPAQPCVMEHSLAFPQEKATPQTFSRPDPGFQIQDLDCDYARGPAVPCVSLRQFLLRSLTLSLADDIYARPQKESLSDSLARDLQEASVL
jgi:hypothetical protein